MAKNKPIKKIESTVENWETRKLGADEKFVEAVTLDDKKLDEAFELQLISIRMRKQLIADLKIIARHNGLGYQTLMKQILERFAQAEMREMAKAFVEAKEEGQKADAEDDNSSPDDGGYKAACA